MFSDRSVLGGMSIAVRVDNFPERATKASAKPKKKAGRPVVAEDPTQRERHILAAVLYYGSHQSVDEVTTILGITRNTLYRWVRLAIGYDADCVKALMRCSKRKIRR